MQFQASEFSHLGGFGATPNPEYVDVEDIPGDTFRIRSDGMIEVLSGSAKGKVFDANSSIGKTMIANLSDKQGNTAKIKSVLDPKLVEEAIKTPRLPAAPSAPPASALPAKAEEKGAGKTPLTKRTWFWPVVILGVAGAAGAAIVFWPKKGAAASFA